MLVLKFGGSSLGSIENINRVKNIIDTEEKKVVVLSAIAGTTDALLTISECYKFKEIDHATELINDLALYYKKLADALIPATEIRQEITTYFNTLFTQLRSFNNLPYSKMVHQTIVAYGEMLSTFLISRFLIQEGLEVELISALDFMRIDKSGEPDSFYIQQNLERQLYTHSNRTIYITQGFICLDVFGTITNLQRGGSDYTATIIAAALKAREVQIWTDIDGFHNNDPRVVKETHPLSHLSYDEAGELAYFGAKILHPQTVSPVRNLEIPVRLKNTMAPEADGTLISNISGGDGIKAIAAKDNITVITIKSARMLLAHGFLNKVFEIFAQHETAIDMITTSEVSISLTIDDARNLAAITQDLEKFASLEVYSNQSIVCLVGHQIMDHPDTINIFRILREVPTRMISYGGSENNISLVVDSHRKTEVLIKLHEYLFQSEYSF